MKESNLSPPILAKTSGGKDCRHQTVESTDAAWDCNRDNLSPPVLAKNKGTAVFRLVPLQGEVSGSVSRRQPHTASERTVQGKQSLTTKVKLTGAFPIPCLYCIGSNSYDEYNSLSTIHLAASSKFSKYGGQGFPSSSSFFFSSFPYPVARRMDCTPKFSPASQSSILSPII